MTCVVVDYGSGNLRSAAKALERAAQAGGSGERILVSAHAEDVAAADRIVLPGVGAFGDCRNGIRALPGMEEALSEAVLKDGKPFLGICVGMQLLAERGLEHGSHAGFGWIGGEVVPLMPADPALKVPHMGWNDLRLHAQHPALATMGSEPYVYFVHSYHFRPAEPGRVLAETDYGGPVAAIVGRDNILGTQFHPEKSQTAGLALLAGFLEWRP